MALVHLAQITPFLSHLTRFYKKTDVIHDPLFFEQQGRLLYSHFMTREDIE